MNGLFLHKALLPDGWADNVRIAVSEGRIVSVTRGQTAQIGDEKVAIGLPGLPNLHSHAFQRGMAGLTERRGPSTDNFWTWREQMYRFANETDADDIETIATQAYVEMLEAGFTHVVEFHYVHNDRNGAPYQDVGELAKRIIAAAEEVGIGLTLLPVFYAQSGFGGKASHDGQRRFVTTIDRFARIVEGCREYGAQGSDIVTGIAPHSLRAVAPNDLLSLIPLANGGPIHVHAAEQVREVDDCVAWSGQRPVEWLISNTPVDRRWCLIHATHMTESETKQLAKSGAVAGLCPITEANLGDGVFNGRAFLEAGGVLGIGTDSNVFIDAASELRQLEYSQRLFHRQRNVMAMGEGVSAGRALYDAALKGGAQAAGLETCSLTAGARADILSLDPEHPSLSGGSGDAILDAWIFAAARGPIQSVWVRGRKVVENGRHRRGVETGKRFKACLRKVLSP